MSDATTDTYVQRITALLDKAESTEFEAEAEAFLAKAQELMARHAIDEAMLASARTEADVIAQDNSVIEPPYASAKSTLLNAVARSNNCRLVTSTRPGGRQYCTLVGYESDLANVRLLYAALSFQAMRFMLAAEVPRGDTPRRFRHAFLLAFGARIGERLRAAELQAQADAAQEQPAPGGPSVSVVVASRTDAVQQALHEAFPRLRTRTTSISSAAGYQSGRAAADRSSLNQRPLGGNRPGLPGG